MISIRGLVQGYEALSSFKQSARLELVHFQIQESREDVPNSSVFSSASLALKGIMSSYLESI